MRLNQVKARSFVEETGKIYSCRTRNVFILLLLEFGAMISWFDFKQQALAKSFLYP